MQEERPLKVHQKQIVEFQQLLFLFSKAKCLTRMYSITSAEQQQHLPFLTALPTRGADPSQLLTRSGSSHSEFEKTGTISYGTNKSSHIF